MITRNTAERIWVAYREIEAAEKLIEDTEQATDQFERDKHAPTLKDAFGRRKHLELGVPCGENGHRIFRVAPELAGSVIRAHIAKMRSELAEANEQARVELSENTD